MKRAGLVVVVMALAGCLEPGDLSGEVYEAIGARDSGVPQAGSGGQGGSGGGGSGGTSGSGGSGSGGTSGTSGTGGGDAAMPSECGDVLEDLLKPSCASTFCHSTAAGGVLDLEADDSLLIGKEASSSCDGHVYINADNPEESLIYTKLNDPPPCGAQMPFSGDKFTDEQKACVLEYIEQVIQTNK